MELAGKIAIVTGGDSGIGKAIAIELARSGASVVVDYVGERLPADELVAEIAAFGGSAVVQEADVSKPGDAAALIERAVQSFGGLDILVNNAGTEEKHPFLEMPLAVAQRIVAVNFFGTWHCSQAAAEQMCRQRRGGRIVNISSVHEELAMPTNAAYCATKGAVRMLMRTIAVELAPYGITVNNVCPGAVDMPMDENVKEDPEAFESLLSEIPLGRMAQPAEIAALVVYLASDAGAYVTGASYVIDGGMSKRSGSL
ncbi:MAG TPA: glucose 1-dehydrogenase [Candidatus Cybelea sp.]|jgi:glucose 1-dehydrogenase|nr:glucose 1-dehydrogenase [Candidatus Cybelea sp.]